MFDKPIFETLPIAVIALSIMLIVFAYHPVSLVAGLGLILASCIVIYRRYSEMGTDTNALDFKRSA